MSSTRKISRIGKAKIINDEYVVKKKNKDINYLYQYLSSKDFYSYPELIDENERDYIYKFIDSKRSPRIEDTLKLLATLHKNTTEDKLVTEDTFKRIYNKVTENIIHIKYFYESLITKIEMSDYFSPSEYLLMRNISKILFMIKYSEDEIEKWYNSVKDKHEFRVCTIHNNPSLSNTIIGKEPFLSSFDNYSKDSPVIDLYKFYKNENFDTKILDKMDVYNEIFTLNEDERKLFNILITLPCKLKLNSSEYENTLEVKNFIEKVYNIEGYIKKVSSVKEEQK